MDDTTTLSALDVELLLALVEGRLLECDPDIDPPAYIGAMQDIRVKLQAMKKATDGEHASEDWG